MKVKTFTGTHRFVVDRQVNDWLAKSNVTVRRTDVAFKALRDRGWDAVAGKATTRRAVALNLDAGAVDEKARECMTRKGYASVG